MEGGKKKKDGISKGTVFEMKLSRETVYGDTKCTGGSGTLLVGQGNDGGRGVTRDEKKRTGSRNTLNSKVRPDQGDSSG